MILPERSGKHQQQQLSQKVSAKHSVRAVHESVIPKVAPKGAKHPSSSAPALPAVLSAQPAALGRTQRRRSATGAAAWPRQGPPPPHRSAGGRPTTRCGGSSCASPTLAPRPPAPAHRPASTHSCPLSRWAGRSYHPRPQQRGAPQRQHHHRGVVVHTIGVVWRTRPRSRNPAGFPKNSGRVGRGNWRGELPSIPQ